MNKSDFIKQAAQSTGKHSPSRSDANYRIKAKKKTEIGFNFFFAGLMLCYLMWQLVIWVFNHLTLG